MAAAVIDQLEDSVVNLITVLALTLGSTPVVVERRKWPRHEKGVDTLPLIQVTCAAQPGKDTFWDTGRSWKPGRKRREYVLEVNLNASGNQDITANEGTYQKWRQLIMGIFEPPEVLGVAEFYEMLLEPGPGLDREATDKNYDLSRIFLRLVTIENASNQ